jgi:hypothetical protein
MAHIRLEQHIRAGGLGKVGFCSSAADRETRGVVCERHKGCRAGQRGRRRTRGQFGDLRQNSCLQLLRETKVTQLERWPMLSSRLCEEKALRGGARATCCTASFFRGLGRSTVGRRPRRVDQVALWRLQHRAQRSGATGRATPVPTGPPGERCESLSFPYLRLIFGLSSPGEK